MRLYFQNPFYFSAYPRAARAYLSTPPTGNSSPETSLDALLNDPN